MAEGDRIPEPPDTLVTCLACGGDFEKLYTQHGGAYAQSVCAWCTHGAMTAKQLAKWHARKMGRNV